MKYFLHLYTYLQTFEICEYRSQRIWIEMLCFHNNKFVSKSIYFSFQWDVPILFPQSKISENEITYVKIMMCHVISIKLRTFVCILDMQIR